VLNNENRKSDNNCRKIRSSPDWRRQHCHATLKYLRDEGAKAKREHARQRTTCHRSLRRRDSYFISTRPLSRIDVRTLSRRKQWPVFFVSGAKYGPLMSSISENRERSVRDQIPATINVKRSVANTRLSRRDYLPTCMLNLKSQLFRLNFFEWHKKQTALMSFSMI